MTAPHTHRTQAYEPPRAACHRTRAPGRRGSPVARFNTWFAIVVSRAVGSMWCAYLFAILCFISLPDAIGGGTATLISWIAQNFLQLVLLSVMMVAQNAEAEAAERRSKAMYEAMYKDAELLLRQEGRAAEQIAAQGRVVAAIARELGIDLADVPEQ